MVRGRHIQAGAETVHPASEYQPVRAGRGVCKTSSYGIRPNVRKEDMSPGKPKNNSPIFFVGS